MSTSTQPRTGGKHAAAPAAREQTPARAQEAPSRPGKRMRIVAEAEPEVEKGPATLVAAPETTTPTRRFSRRKHTPVAEPPVRPTVPKPAGHTDQKAAEKAARTVGSTTTSTGRRSRRSRRSGPGRRVTNPPKLTAPERHYRFVAPHGFRTFLCGLLAVAIVIAVVGSVLALLTNSRGALTLAAAAASGAAALYGGIGVTRPQVITLTGSLVEIQRGTTTQSFDLVDPAVEIRVRDGEIAFMFYDGDWATVRSREVNWKVFSNVVMYYQNHADRKAEERVDRFLR